MPKLTVRDGARSIVRHIDGPVALDEVCPPVPGTPYANGWTIHPEGNALALVSPAGEKQRTIGPGDALALGDVTLTLGEVADASPPTASPTERLAGDSRPRLMLDVPGGRRVILGTRTITVGKAPRCDIVLSDPTVSDVHCRITPTRDGYEIRDAGSTNGTRVAGIRVHSALLSPGVAIVLGRTRILCGRDPKDETTGTISGPPGTVLVGDSPAMEAVRQAIDRFAKQVIYPVLILGETGAGKEIVARSLHDRSPRARGPFVAINAATIAPELVESELFGHERGSFTGAAARRRGVFEEAHGGTLFLDELGELPLAQQAKLLRVLETREVRRVGGEGTVKIDVRIVCATHRDLAARAALGHFRTDLRYRLEVLTITLPALRDRTEDIPALARHLLGRVANEIGRAKHLEDAALGALMEHDWPGNVRELYGVLCRAAVEADGERVGIEHLSIRREPPVVDETEPAESAPRESGMFTPLRPPPLPREIHGSELLSLVAACGGNLSRVARATGLARSTLRDRLRKTGFKG